MLSDRDPAAASDQIILADEEEDHPNTDTKSFGSLQSLLHWLQALPVSFLKYIFCPRRFIFKRKDLGSVILIFFAGEDFTVQDLKPNSVATKLRKLLTIGCFQSETQLKNPVHVTVSILSPGNGDPDEIHFCIDFERTDGTTSKEVKHETKLKAEEIKLMIEEMDPTPLQHWIFEQLQINSDTKHKFNDIGLWNDMTRQEQMEFLLESIGEFDNGYDMLAEYCEENEAYVFNKVFEKTPVSIEKEQKVDHESILSYRKGDGHQELYSMWIDMDGDQGIDEKNSDIQTEEASLVEVKRNMEETEVLENKDEEVEKKKTLRISDVDIDFSSHGDVESTTDLHFKPWRILRHFNYLILEALKERIKQYTPPNDEVHQARILMIGPMGAGKSSFFNTINSIFSDRITVYRQHNIRPKGGAEALKFCLCDTCGILENDGPSLDDLKYFLDGNVPDGYEFSPSTPITPNIRGFIKYPGLKDRVHCVVFVFDATTIERMSPGMWNKLEQIQNEVMNREIPIVILLTKIEKLSMIVQEDVSKAFTSSEVLRAVEQISQILGIPEHNIHPIINYERETQLDAKISLSALDALEQMLAFAGDFIDAQSSLLLKVKPWRNPTPHMSRETLLTLMESIENYRPPSAVGVEFARILMIGPIGAGKSSFFNSVDSIFSGQISRRSICGSSQKSLTTTYRQFKIKGYQTGEYLKFILCDTCGIDRMGPDLAELMFLLEGNVPDGYQFNPAVPMRLDNPGFIKNPGLKDKVHCVVFVLDATAVDVIEHTTWEKLNRLQTRMNAIGLPRAVLLTKIDQVSQPVSEDVSKVFSSDEVHKVVHKVSEMLGLQQNKIYPIKNYENETFLNDKISNLSLLALDQILGFASDFLSRDTTGNKYLETFLVIVVIVALVALYGLIITYFNLVVIAAIVSGVVFIIYASVFRNELPFMPFLVKPTHSKK